MMQNLTNYLLATLSCMYTLSGLSQSDTYLNFENGQSQLVEAFSNPEDWIQESLWVETEFDSDGDGDLDRMHVNVTRPKQTETEAVKLPVVYASSPYFSGVSSDGKSIFWNVNHELGSPPVDRKLPSEIPYNPQNTKISNSYTKMWIPRGYIVVHSSSPGTGLSDGSPTVGGLNESLAPKAVIEWLGGKDNGYTSLTGSEKTAAYWSTGNVGMIGVSYNGTLPIAAATTGVENLKAIIPVAPNTSYYHYYRSNGLVRSPGGYLGEDIDVLFDFIHSGNPENRAYARKVVRDSILSLGMDRLTGDYNTFWASRDYLNQMDNFKTALLMAHGFNDWNVMPEHSYRIYNRARELGVPHQIYYHQEGHGGHPPIEMMNKWFTRYLHNIQNGVENDPKAWIVREGEHPNNPTAYPDYPNPNVELINFYPNGNGLTQGELSLEPSVNKPTISKFTDNVQFSADTLAQLETSEHRLLYVTKPLEKPLHISGISKIKLSIASSKEAANLSVWLVSLPWNTSTNAHLNENIISRTWADPQNYNSLSSSEKLTTGKFYDLEISFQPDDQIIPSGQQIGLLIFSSDKDFTLWPEPGTELQVDTSKTRLSIPVVKAN